MQKQVPTRGTPRNAVWAILLAFMLVFALLAPAAVAYGDTDNGTQGCGNYFVKITSKAKQNVTHEWPNGTPRIGWYQALYTFRYSNTSLQSTSWLVGADVDVIENKTYASCVSVG